MSDDGMLEEYDFSNSRPNPFARKLKKQITIRIDADLIDYFKKQVSEVGIPYQSLINLYLADCADNYKKPKLSWT